MPIIYLLRMKLNEPLRYLLASFSVVSLADISASNSDFVDRNRQSQGDCRMAKYLVESYEFHTQKYLVEAESRAEAIFNFYRGDGEEVGSSEMIEMSGDHGLNVDDNGDLVRGLAGLGEKVGDDIIAGICDVNEISGENNFAADE